MRAPKADDTIAFTWAKSFQPADQAPHVLEMVARLLLPLVIAVEWGVRYFLKQELQ